MFSAVGLPMSIAAAPPSVTVCPKVTSTPDWLWFTVDSPPQPESGLRGDAVDSTVQRRSPLSEPLSAVKRYDPAGMMKA